MITADQLAAHLIGDYILQSDWMATEKTQRSIAAIVHAVTYALPFLLLRPSILAFLFVVGTHFVIDRWRLARYVVWLKNFIAPVRIVRSKSQDLFGMTEYGAPVIESDSLHVRPWVECVATGYPQDRPVWLTTWLMIIADNTMHVILNGVALRWL